MNQDTLHTTIVNSLEKSMSYQEYRDLVSTLAVEESTTGDVVSEALVDYTKLNDRRMKRWEKTLKVPSDLEDKIKAFDSKTKWIILTESWCGDAAHVMPVIDKVAEINDKVNVRVVLRDENDVLMNQFLTDGNKSIPKIIVLDDDTNEVLTTYGPRPSVATQIVNDFKKEHGKLTAEFKQDLQVWYNKDKGQTTIEDVTNLLCELQPSSCL